MCFISFGLASPWNFCMSLSLLCDLGSFHISFWLSGEHEVGLCSLRSQRKYFLTCVDALACTRARLCVCAHGTQQNRGKWKSSYAGASHRCPEPPPAYFTACSVCIPLWHCPDGALHRPAGGPISRESMSVELPRECEWSRLFLNSGSSGTRQTVRMVDTDIHNFVILTTCYISGGKIHLWYILNYLSKTRNQVSSVIRQKNWYLVFSKWCQSINMRNKETWL